MGGANVSGRVDDDDIVGETSVGAVEIGDVGVLGCVGVVEGAAVDPTFRGLKMSDCASSAILLILSSKPDGTVPPALIIAVSAAEKIAAASKLLYVVPGGITEFQSILLN